MTVQETGSAAGGASQAPAIAWYVGRDGQQYGPVGDPEFRAMLELGKFCRPIWCGATGLRNGSRRLRSDLRHPLERLRRKRRHSRSLRQSMPPISVRLLARTQRRSRKVMPHENVRSANRLPNPKLQRAKANVPLARKARSNAGPRKWAVALRGRRSCCSSR